MPTIEIVTNIYLWKKAIRDIDTDNAVLLINTLKFITAMGEHQVTLHISRR